LFLQFFLKRGKWLILVDGGKRENRLDDCGIFERMEVSRDSFGSLKS
jgi:hypothetical protein